LKYEDFEDVRNFYDLGIGLVGHNYFLFYKLSEEKV